MKMRPAVTIAPLAGVAIIDSRKLTVQAVASEAETVRVLTSISGATNGLRSPAGPSRRPRKQSATSETSHSSRTAALGKRIRMPDARLPSVSAHAGC